MLTKPILAEDNQRELDKNQLDHLYYQISLDEIITARKHAINSLFWQDATHDWNDLVHSSCLWHDTKKKALLGTKSYQGEERIAQEIFKRSNSTQPEKLKIAKETNRISVLQSQHQYAPQIITNMYLRPKFHA